VGATAVLCVLLFGAGGGPAEAAFPGRNGGIAFDSDLAVPGEQLDIFTVSPKGGSPVNLTNNPALDQQPSWSPDGRKITFASNRDGDFEIFVMNADGSDLRQITFNSTGDFDPAWSPNGQQIALWPIAMGTPRSTP
jgi:TolB protein